MVDGEEGDVVVALSRGGMSCTSSFGMKTSHVKYLTKSVGPAIKSLSSFVRSSNSILIFCTSSSPLAMTSSTGALASKEGRGRPLASR